MELKPESHERMEERKCLTNSTWEDIPGDEEDKLDLRHLVSEVQVAPGRA